MPHPPLISAAELLALLEQPQSLVIADCRYVLTDPAAGVRAYNQGHIPGALHADLGDLLSGPTTGMNGRHPLPDPETFVANMAALGANNETLIVAYDAGDSMFAARLWWLLRWVGHENVRVLDGGLPAWISAGGGLVTSTHNPARGSFTLRQRAMPTVTFIDVLQNVQSRQRVLVDARSPDRFRGENETIDPVGGHIPGALNHFFKENVDASGRFKSPGELRAALQSLLGDTPAEQVIHQCGSGVTACHNLLAMEIAGLPGASLYPGSWSEWCRQRDVPIATGRADSE